MPVLVPHQQQGFLARYLAVQRVSERELRELLADASRDAEARVRALAGKEGIGAQVRRAQLTVARIELAKIVDDLGRPIERNIATGIRASAHEGGVSFFKILDVLERGLGKVPGLRESIIAQARRGAENLISRGMNDIPLSRQVYRTGALAKDQLHRFLNNRIAAGSSWKEIADGVRRFISPFTEGGVSYAAKRLARSELNNAFHTTQIRTSLKSPFVDGYQWRLSGSHPRPDDCNRFAEEDHDGLGAGVFAKENVPGKPHPNCLCYLMFVTPSVEEFQTRFLRGDYDRYLDSLIEQHAPQLLATSKSARKALR